VLGTIMHDGGMPVNGFARGISEEEWCNSPPSRELPAAKKV
jgi:hypothetical protein